MHRLIVPSLFASLLWAQAPATQTVRSESQPLYKVTVASRTAKAINYRHRGGATKVDFAGTALMSKAAGEAKVEGKQGYIEVEVEFKNISGPASQFGPEYLTYVMWAISPEGRASNLGEVILNGNRSKLNVSTELQTFGLIVTAEPYFAVTRPSDVVVMENIVRNDTKGGTQIIDAKYELLERGQYTLNVDRSSVKTPPANVSLDIQQAQNAVQIARWAGADKYAKETFDKAVNQLKQAEDYRVRKQVKPSSTVARDAVQAAEDARNIALRRQQEERLANERKAAAEREAAERANAEEQNRRRIAEEQKRAEAEANARLEAQRRAQADAQRAEAEKLQAAAQAASAQANLDRAAAEKAKAEADAARAAAMTQQQLAQAEAEKARLAAGEADKLRLAAEQDKEALRQRLLQQFNAILDTRDTARGLVVNMSDVLFDTAKYTLRPLAREKLARVAGIILGHPGLRIEVEGHTDSVGGEAYNQRLSEQRAESVQSYLVSQGLAGANVTARGFGKTTPVASNDTAAGRQQNRRVELVVSGEVIGTKLSDSRSLPSNVTPQP
jgi:outer membrane protein OmpA-like peptidoglycan-associated protein